MVNYLSYSFENAASRFGFGGFRVHAQEILGSRGANHHPAGRTQIELDAVHIFPAHHRQIKDNGPFDIRKVSDGKIWTASRDRKSTRLNSSHMSISYAVFCLKKKKKKKK